MNRKLSVERTYALRQYENIKLFDEIEVPEELTYSAEFLEKLRGLQIIQLEITYRKYLNLAEKLLPYNIEDANNVLFEMRDNLTDSIKETLTTKSEKGE